MPYNKPKRPRRPFFLRTRVRAIEHALWEHGHPPTMRFFPDDKSIDQQLEALKTKIDQLAHAMGYEFVETHYRPDYELVTKKQAEEQRKKDDPWGED